MESRDVDGGDDQKARLLELYSEELRGHAFPFARPDVPPEVERFVCAGVAEYVYMARIEGMPWGLLRIALQVMVAGIGRLQKLCGADEMTDESYRAVMARALTAADAMVARP